MTLRIVRKHHFDAGHRVYGHEGQCARLHGHGYEVEIVCTAANLDRLGRVIDFGVIKSTVCAWIDAHWDHRTLLWEQDPLADWLLDAEAGDPQAIVQLPSNPTAENLAAILLEEARRLLLGTGITVEAIIMHETRKCRAEVS